MRDPWKRRIRMAFDAPAPDRQKKERFLRTLPQPKISIPQFIFYQIAYMRKRTWVLSVLLLVPALIGAYQIKESTLWTVSSFVPFLGLLAVSESTRSTKYGMCEFEMTTRFSLKNILLARMCVTGILDFTILCCMIPLCHTGNGILLLQTGVYLFVPYLLTVNLCLWFTRHFRGKENIYGCMSIAVLISGANGLMHYGNAQLFQNTSAVVWGMVSALLLAGMAYEISRTIRQTEELVWN